MTITIENIKVIKTSPKGAALIEANDKQVWIKPAAAKKLNDGTVLPSVIKAIEEADQRNEELSKKRPFRRVKPKLIMAESEKSILVLCHDGTKAWLPKSQIKKDILSGLLVPAWLIEKTNLQASGKLVWI